MGKWMVGQISVTKANPDSPWLSMSDLLLKIQNGVCFSVFACD